MTLLFYFKSPNEWIDVGVPEVIYEEMPLEPYKKKRKTGTIRQIEYDNRIAKRQKDEEELMFLLNYIFDDYDD